MADSSRDAVAIGELVTATFGQPPAEIKAIAAGLGTRRFYRVMLAPDRTGSASPETLIARVEPSARELEASRQSGSGSGSSLDADLTWLPEPALEPIRSCLEAAGLPVPVSYGRSRGLDLIEDVGSETLLQRARSALERGPDTAANERLRADYLAAAELIPRVQRVESDAGVVEAFERHYDQRLISTKTEKFLRWCWPGLVGRDATSDEVRTIHAIRDVLTTFLRGAPERLAHRDFKAENLHWWRGRFVMIDTQGAFMAPPEYDLACLVFDLQVTLPDALIETVISSTLPHLPDSIPEADARARLDVLGVLRLAKDIAHVVDAARRRHDARRWHEVPRGFELLRAASQRLETRFPELRALTNVIHTLSRGHEASDSRPLG